MCDTVVRVEAGRVLFAKNSDRDPNEAQLLEWHPARDHAPGELLQCTWIEIPQVPRTYAVLLSRPFWMWGAEIGVNEHGVVTGNEAVFTTQPYRREGLTGMDLQRLALERATTAEQAVGVLTSLLAEHGQGGGCGHEDRSFTYHNSFIVADHRGAFVVETAGEHWAVEEVGEGTARSISNGLTIPGFAEQHSDRLKTAVSACRARQPLTEAGAADADGVLDLFRLLRTHAERGGPRYSWLNGAMSAPCMHAGGLVASSQTTASWVAELTPRAARHWATATSAPCTGVFKPVDVAVPLDLGPDPTDAFDARALWWRHEQVHRSVIGDPRAVASLRREGDELERAWAASPPAPAQAFAEADRLLDRWRDEAAGIRTDERPSYVRRYWRTRDRRAGMPAAASLRSAQADACSDARRA